MKNLKFKSDYLIILILVLASVLRLVNLGYSDYIGDEQKAMLIPGKDQSVWSFLIEQRKGPMQFLISYIPRLFVGDFRNEFAERLPFALISIASVFVFYILVKKLTKNITVSVSSTFLFMVSGFIVGFGRIAQYQNLNIIFSLLALYFYSDLKYERKHLIRRTLAGTLFWCLSIMSHWDGVFILPVVVWFFIGFFRDTSFTSKYKIRIVVYNFILGCVFLLPFMIPYVTFHLNNGSSSGYFQRRIGLGYSNNKIYKMFIDLYNPFLTFWLLVVLSLLSLLKFKKSIMYLVWFLTSYVLFEVFVRKPGTHIYNFLIPVFILSGFGFYNFLELFKVKKIKILLISLSVVMAIFLYYQSYIIFVDHRREYPWESDEYFVFDKGCEVFPKVCKKYDISKMVLKTKEYHYDYEGQKLPLFGFPHSRNWSEINDFINQQNLGHEKCLGYATNEDQSLCAWYMDTPYKSSGEFYFVGITRPTDFVFDPSPPHGSEKDLIKTFESEDGSVYARIWLVKFKN